MKKILIFIILILFFYSFTFAENDINKLSKKDREQCEKIKEIYKNKDSRYSFLKFNLFPSFFEYIGKDPTNFYIPYPSDGDLVNDLIIIASGTKITGVKELNEWYYEVNELHISELEFDMFNVGYYIRYVDYYKYIHEIDDNTIQKFLRKNDYLNKYYLDNLVFIKNITKNLQKKILFIQIKNCFVIKHNLQKFNYLN